MGPLINQNHPGDRLGPLEADSSDEFPIDQNTSNEEGEGTPGMDAVEMLIEVSSLKSYLICHCCKWHISVHKGKVQKKTMKKQTNKC